jgi:hypothetical protein
VALTLGPSRFATGVRTSYLSDLWVWDTLNYKWYQIEHSAVDRKPGSVIRSLPLWQPVVRAGPLPPSSLLPPHPPLRWARAYVVARDRSLTRSSLYSARSGHSFLPCPEGLILHGGYTKTYEGKRVTGMALSDTWLLRLPPPNEAGEIDFRASRWEKRKASIHPIHALARAGLLTRIAGCAERWVRAFAAIGLHDGAVAGQGDGCPVRRSV